MKIKIKDELAWYFKHNDQTPRFQHVNITSAEFEYDTDPTFISGDRVVKDIQEYANTIKAHIQSLDAQMRMDKVFYDRYLLHNTDELQTQAGAKGPNSEGTPQKETTNTPMPGKSAHAPATPTLPPPEGGNEISEKQQKYIGVLAGMASRAKRYDVITYLEDFLDTRKYKSTWNMTKHEAHEVIEKIKEMMPEDKKD